MFGEVLWKGISAGGVGDLGDGDFGRKRGMSEFWCLIYVGNEGTNLRICKIEFFDSMNCSVTESYSAAWWLQQRWPGWCLWERGTNANLQDIGLLVSLFRDDISTLEGMVCEEASINSAREEQ